MGHAVSCHIHVVRVVDVPEYFSQHSSDFLSLPQHSSAMPNQHKPCRLFFFFTLLALPTHLAWINFTAPLALIESDIRRFHSQGVSIPKMVPLLRKHYDTDLFGIG